MNTVVNQTPFIRTTWNFPVEAPSMSVEMNRAYVDIASFINARTIGIFPTNKPAVTGETWYFTPQKQQTLRQLFAFTSTANIPHNLNLDRIFAFARLFGAYTDGTNWYGLIGGTSVAIPGQISFYITPQDIVFVVGAGAPPLTKGNLVIEWISNISVRQDT